MFLAARRLSTAFSLFLAIAFLLTISLVISTVLVAISNFIKFESYHDKLISQNNLDYADIEEFIAEYNVSLPIVYYSDKKYENYKVVYNKLLELHNIQPDYSKKTIIFPIVTLNPIFYQIGLNKVIDVLIEEDNDTYTLNESYYQKIKI